MKAENVVKPPHTPTIRKMRISGCSPTRAGVRVTAATTPMRKDPSTLISSVPQGNRGPVRAVIAPASQNRAMLPRAPPAATAIHAPMLSSALQRIAALRLTHGTQAGVYIITRLIISVIMGKQGSAPLDEFHRDLL